jgi:hypothetical protein
MCTVTYARGVVNSLKGEPILRVLVNYGGKSQQFWEEKWKDSRAANPSSIIVVEVFHRN